MMTAMYSDAATAVGAQVEVEDVGVPLYVITPPAADRYPDLVYLDVHGGALIMGGGECCRAMGTVAAARVQLRTYAVDYRMPPDHPFPTPLDDCLAAYRWVLDRHRPEDVIVGGASAGGNLAAALILRARDEGLPMPAGAILLTPELDLTESGDSFTTNLGLDTVLHHSQAGAIGLYAPGMDLRNPYISPLFGDFGPGHPPTFLQAGTRDLFLSNAVLMHRALRRAGVAAELHVFEAMPHGGFGGAPEDAELTDEIRRFVASVATPGKFGASRT
jgi:acetyl esterase/lipase